jgi:hypothetical protein
METLIGFFCFIVFLGVVCFLAALDASFDKRD